MEGNRQDNLSHKLYAVLAGDAEAERAGSADWKGRLAWQCLQDQAAHVHYHGRCRVSDRGL